MVYVFSEVLEKLHGQMRKLEDEIVTLRKKDDDGKPVSSPAHARSFENEN